MSEASELARMSDRELVAYWNVLQFGNRMFRSAEADRINAVHKPIVDHLLTQRGIPHVDGRRTSVA